LSSSPTTPEEAGGRLKAPALAIAAASMLLKTLGKTSRSSAARSVNSEVPQSRPDGDVLRDEVGEVDGSHRCAKARVLSRALRRHPKQDLAARRRESLAHS
jgi:hypothetical protein